MTTKGRRYIAPVGIRSRLMLEVASELVGVREWPYKQVRMTLREQGGEAWGPTLFASDSPDVIHEVAAHDVQIAIINPGVVLTLAHRGTGPFKEPVPVRAITVIQSYDQLLLAVSEKTGLTSLDDIREKRYPLRVSLRGQRSHATHLVLNEVLAAAGFSFDDIRAWGGEVRYDGGTPAKNPDRTGAVERGEADAIFDEAVGGWTEEALGLGMRPLPIDGPVLDRLEGLGFRRGTMAKASYPSLSSDHQTIDYSGFIVYTHADVPDDTVGAVCAALEARKDRIPPDTGEGPLPLDVMCKDTVEGPLGIPLHQAAEQFWRERGYLS